MAENWHPNYRTVEKRRQIKQTGTQRNGRDGGPRIAKPLYGLKPYRGSKETKTSMAEREGFGFQRLSAKLTPRRSPLVLDLRDRFIETADRHFGHQILPRRLCAIHHIPPLVIAQGALRESCWRRIGGKAAYPGGVRASTSPLNEWYAVIDTNVLQLSQPGAFSDPFTEVLRSGARALLAQAIEAEVAALLSAHAEGLTADGRQRLVRHGCLPEREIMTGLPNFRTRQSPRPKLAAHRWTPLRHKTQSRCVLNAYGIRKTPARARYWKEILGVRVSGESVHEAFSFHCGSLRSYRLHRKACWGGAKRCLVPLSRWQ
jgi:hypothetical protein